MTLPAGTVLRVVSTLVWSDASVVQNVFNTILTGAGGPYAEADVLTDARTWVGTMFGNLTSLMTNQIGGSSVQVYQFDPGGQDWDEVGELPWGFAPTSPGEPLPRPNAAFLRAKTIDNDVIGKKFIGGLTENSNDGSGLVGAATLTALGLLGLDWVTPFTGLASGADFVPCTWSPTKGTAVSFVGSVLLQSIFAQVGSRKRGVGA